MDIDWNRELVDQLDWHWREHLRPRMDGLTDDEYFWEPVPGCWNVRARRSDGEPGTGAFTIEYTDPEPVPPPVTTIAWRLAHIIVGVLGERVAAHFGGPECSYGTFAYAGSAAEALAQLDDVYAAWIDGARSLGADGLARPCGAAEPYFPDSPEAALVLHINRETIHHAAEITLLRDLYRAKGSTTDGI
jgi:DinB superfamily